MANFYKILRSPKIKQGLNLGGIIFALIGMGFVIKLFFVYKINLLNLSLKTVMTLMGMSVIYGGANLLLVRAWQKILQHHGVSIQFGQSVQIYGRSQLAKYIPGNIFQYAGRQALGVSAGLPNKALALSAVWELGWVVTVGGIFVLLPLPLIVSEISVLFSWFLFIFAVIILLWVTQRLVSPTIAHAAVMYFIFHIISGLIFTIVLIQITSSSQIFQIPSISGAYIVAWLIGLVTPGAPGGVGIREMVLYQFFNRFINPPDLLVAIALSRIVTIGGDGIFFIFSLFRK